MERTPFDEPIAPPAVVEDDPSTDAQSAPAPRAPSRWLWPALGVIALVLVMIGGGIWAGQRAENARLSALRERVNAIARNDNALVLEVLDSDDSQHITYAEFFARAAKNKADRDTLIRKLRTLVAAPYQSETDNLVRLLEIENDYVRAEEAVTRQKLEVAGRQDALQQLADESAPTGTLDSPYIAPSGEEVSGVTIEASREAGAAFRRYKAAREALALKLNAASAAIDAWLDAEPRLYPKWAPPREVSEALQAKKRRYAITSPDPNAEPDAPINPDPNAPAAPEFAEPPAPEIEPTPTEEPAPTPEPEPTFTPEPTLATDPTPTPESAPTPLSDAPARDDASDALPGERFPQTRQRELSLDELKNLSDDDLRYMTNEMLARYGQTFADKSYQTQFESTPWYHPNANWSSARIRRAFSDLEKSNLKRLIKERERRKKGEY